MQRDVNKLGIQRSTVGTYSLTQRVSLVNYSVYRKKNYFIHDERDVTSAGHAMIENRKRVSGECGSPENASSKSHLHTYHAILMAATASADADDWWYSSVRRRFLLLRLLGNIGPRGIVR